VFPAHLAIANVTKKLRQLRSAIIAINGATQTFPLEMAHRAKLRTGAL